MVSRPTPESLAGFASKHGLAPSQSAVLPAQGATLTHGAGRVEGAATGSLPGDVEGTLAHFTYTFTWTDGDDRSHTETRRFTLDSYCERLGQELKAKAPA